MRSFLVFTIVLQILAVLLRIGRSVRNVYPIRWDISAAEDMLGVAFGCVIAAWAFVLLRSLQ